MIGLSAQHISLLDPPTTLPQPSRTTGVLVVAPKDGRKEMALAFCPVDLRTSVVAAGERRGGSKKIEIFSS
jgi:hypothetical protein